MDVVVFCYNRPDKLHMCLESINLSYVDKLWIFCDGPKRPEHADGVRKTFEIARSFPYENKAVTLRECNYGTPRNVIGGLDQVFETTESCFILEDDCIVKPEAYAYIDWALKTFRDDNRIFSINTMAPLTPFLNKIASFFVKDDIVACNRVYAFWGWATWADRWHEFRSAVEPFKNPYGSAQGVPLKCGQHVRSTLRLYEEGKVGGWDARLLVLTIYARRLHLHPRQSLMRNTGLDGTGSHFDSSQCGVTKNKDLMFSDFKPLVSDDFKDITESRVIYLLGLLYSSLILLRSKLFAFVPKDFKLKARKSLAGTKKEHSQF